MKNQANAAPNIGVFIASPQDLSSVMTVVRKGMTEYAQKANIPQDENGIPLLEALHEPKAVVLQAIRENRVVIARCNWNIVGTLRLDPDQETGICYLRRFVVLSNIRGQGVGHLMFQRANKYASSWGSKSIQLYTNYDNRPLMKFYESLGFHVLSIDHSGTYPRALLTCPLDN